MSKTILLTGGTGFLGSYLAHLFVTRGHHVVGIVRGHANRFRDALSFWSEPKNDGFTAIVGDISTGDGLPLDARTIRSQVGKIDEVWHAAACTKFTNTFRPTLEATNVKGTENVLSLAADLGVERFVHISTAYVAGKGAADEVPGGRGVGWNSFNNPYEETKFEAECLVRRIMPHAVIFRPSILVGRQSDGKTSNFNGFYGFYKLVLRIQQRLKDEAVRADEKVRIEAHKECPINIIPIDLAAEAMLKIVRSPQSLGHVFPITNANPPSFESLNRWAFEYLRIDRIYCESNLNEGTLTKAERRARILLKNYQPYVTKSQSFENRAVEQLIGEKVQCRITKDLAHRLLGYAAGQRFWD